jgi:TonB family protein
VRHENVYGLPRIELLAAILAVAVAKPSVSAAAPPLAEPIPSFAVAADILGRGGPPKSLASAVPILEAVANRGDARAQVMLGAALLQGQIVAQDRIAGYAWLQIGAASGDGPFDATTQHKAAELMRKVEPAMSGSDLIKADQISQRFLADRQRRIDDGVGKAALFYVGELPTEPDLAAFARDPVTVLPGRAPAAGDSFTFGCAAQPALPDCLGAAKLSPEERCTGTIPRSVAPPIDSRNPNLRVKRPAYPAEARRAGLEGDARLVAHVDRSGWICSVRLAISSGSNLLDEAAVQGARRWRLSPGMRDGSPVESLRVIVTSFALTGYEFEK